MAKIKLYARGQMRRFRIARQKHARLLRSYWTGKFNGIVRAWFGPFRR